MIKRVLYCLAAFLLCQATAVAKDIGQPFKVGLWMGSAYTEDNTGAFSHCAASASYNSGIIFLVSVNRNWGWNLGFAHPSWALTPGQTIPINLTFDDRAQFNVVGTATRAGNAVNFGILGGRAGPVQVVLR